MNSCAINTPMCKLDHGSGSEADLRSNRNDKYRLFDHGKTKFDTRICFLHHFLPKCQFRAKRSTCWSGTRTLFGPLKNPPSGPVERS